MLSPLLLLSIVIGYFGLLMLISWLTSRGSNNDSFFIGNRSGNWKLVAFGMIGSTLSGVTFVSVPGTVGTDGFQYLQITFGYIIGYIVVAYILLPIYYKMHLTSIYTYLQERMGESTYKSGAMILDSLGVPFWLTTLLTLLMIILYTYKGGVKTIIWTDTIQTTAMLLGLVATVIYILHHMNISFSESLSMMSERGYLRVFDTNVMNGSFFVKQILAGAFITIAMTGIDQDMMQKNISVSNLKDSQKNMLVLTFILLGMITLFLYMGGILHLFAEQKNITAVKDRLFPTAALEYMSPLIGVTFIIGLISAFCSSADGAMTALTSSICIDIFGIKNKDWAHAKKETFRKKVHILVTISFLIMVMVFKWIDDASMIGLILKLAGFTYGPLLGLFAFGIFTKYKVKDHLVPYICIIAPTLSFLIDKYQSDIFGEFKIGLELLIINGLFTFIGLWLIRKK